MTSDREMKEHFNNPTQLSRMSMISSALTGMFEIILINIDSIVLSI